MHLLGALIRGQNTLHCTYFAFTWNLRPAIHNPTSSFDDGPTTTEWLSSITRLTLSSSPKDDDMDDLLGPMQFSVDAQETIEG